MELAERITFLHPDGRTKRVQRGWVSPTDPIVKIHSSVAPDWSRVGIDVVAADTDGGVIAAFTVDRTETTVERVTKYPGQEFAVLYG